MSLDVRKPQHESASWIRLIRAPDLALKREVQVACRSQVSEAVEPMCVLARVPRMVERMSAARGARMAGAKM